MTNTGEKNGFSTLKDIRRLLDESTVVEVSGLRLRLKAPAALSALEVREKMFATAKDGEPSGALLQAAALALGACLQQNLTEEELMQLVLRTGGESGPLAQKALELCGLDRMLAGAPSTEEQSPVPFS